MVKMNIINMIMHYTVIAKWIVLLRTDFTISHHLDDKAVFQEALFTRDFTRSYKLTSPQEFLKEVL